MNPECESSIPFEALECHHIQPKHLGGCGTPDNGIALCAGCHSLADRFLISPDDCRLFKGGENPYESLRVFSPFDLWDELCSLSEFALVALDDTPNERWNKLARIAYAARHHRKSDEPLCIAICAWTFSDMAAFLTAHIPGRQTLLEPLRHHNRTIVDKYVQRSDEFNRYGNDAFLRIRNLHVRAVNKNALLLLQDSSRLFRRIYRTYVTHAHNTATPMPLDHRKYQAYATRQYVSVLGKCGRRDSLDLAEIAVTMADELVGPSAASDRIEARIRHLQSAVCLGDADRSKACANEVLEGIVNAGGIKRVIAYKILATWGLRRQNLGDAEYFLRKAKDTAIELNLEHQLGQLDRIERLLVGGVDLGFNKGRLLPLMI